MCLILDGLISFLSTLHPVPACEMNTDMTSLLHYHWLGWLADTHTYTRTSPLRPTQKNAECENIKCMKFGSTHAVCTHINGHRRITTDSVSLTDSAFGTASAEGQLKGDRPCQSTQEFWQTAPNVCECVFVESVWGWSGATWAARWPEPQPDFINQGRKRVQPLKLGLKTLLAVFLWCLFLRLNALSPLVLLALFSSFLPPCWRCPLAVSASPSLSLSLSRMLCW